ncbi:hypothetical protein GCM10010435_48030 [Winogradskya consettensis]|uniref:HTH cro/C1-type domain-containing protein n=1 Tax=Winogradskya consettensis TaxID=113560 RepID=A0A919SJQ8_9ACTN|nr:XRE family transcriptional regulator [Actinoplanes consettensis]GIM72966.1 hypothetical protein Aco04nite_32960 [Actinoplanes consettensis]
MVLDSERGRAGRDRAGRDRADRSAEDRFAAELRHWRHTQRMTQEGLAEASGLSVRGIRSLERGQVRAPRRRTVALLAEALRLNDGDREGFLTLAIDPPPAAPAPGHHAGVLVPHELPPAINDLTGRTAELAHLAALSGAAATGGDTGPTVVVLHGLAGVGKTTLAVASGHRLRERFPDGQIYIDLSGTAPATLAATDPAPAFEQTVTLGRILRSLGVPDSRIPRSAAERTALYRTVTQGRHLLVVFDNAVSERQVRPLLPSAPGCLVLITACRPLTGLEAVERLALPMLDHEAGVRLLQIIIGPRATAEAGATAELARLCGYLPLALRIAGNRLASRPSWSVARIVGQLRDEDRRLGALTAGDQGVREAFSVSHAQLAPATALVFRHCAAIAHADFDVTRAAAAAGLSEPDTDAALEELVDAGLLLTVGRRYRFHDLVALYAAERLRREHQRGPAGALSNRGPV